jgi:hypothetical protein
MFGLKIIRLQKRRYPICPECGRHSIVLFTPPKEGLVGTEKGYALLSAHSQEYVDWDRAHLYCCNGETNCKFNTPLNKLTTPLQEPK